MFGSDKIQFLKEVLEDESSLSLQSMDKDPFVQFDKWFQKRIEHNNGGYNDFILSTSTPDGLPSARTVLLKKYTREGFVFFTNYNSPKMQNIFQNPQVALTFHWIDLERDIRVFGKAQKMDRSVSEAYFDSRPRSSQIATWVSQQSEEIDSRSSMEKNFQQFRLEHFAQKISCPPHWGAVCVLPQIFEFWQKRSGRFHDRILYTLDGDLWLRKRLMP